MLNDEFRVISHAIVPMTVDRRPLESWQCLQLSDLTRCQSSAPRSLMMQPICELELVLGHRHASNCPCGQPPIRELKFAELLRLLQPPAGPGAPPPGCLLTNVLIIKTGLSRHVDLPGREPFAALDGFMRGRRQRIPVSRCAFRVGHVGRDRSATVGIDRA